MEKKKAPEEEPKTGAPKKDIDLQLLAVLSEVGASIEEIAAMISRQSANLGGDTISSRTLKRRLKDEPEFREAWENGVNVGKAKLRLQQVKLSKLMNSAGVQMAIHLGRHWLGQHERLLNLNVSIDDLDRAIAELERRAVEATRGQPAGDARDNRPPATPAGAPSSTALH